MERYEEKHRIAETAEEIKSLGISLSYRKAKAHFSMLKKVKKIVEEVKPA